MLEQLEPRVRAITRGIFAAARGKPDCDFVYDVAGQLPTAVIGTSGGGIATAAAQQHLKAILLHMDAIVLGHAPERLTIEEYPDYPIPPMPEVIDEYLRAGRLTNRNIRCVGISINSSTLDDDGWRRYRAQIECQLQLPICDPMRGGVDAIAKALLAG